MLEGLKKASKACRSPFAHVAEEKAIGVCEAAEVGKREKGLFGAKSWGVRLFMLAHLLQILILGCSAVVIDEMPSALGKLVSGASMNNDLLGNGKVPPERPFTSSLRERPERAGQGRHPPPPSYDQNKWYEVLEGPWGYGDAIQKNRVHLDIFVDGSKYEKGYKREWYSVLPNGDRLYPDEEITLDQDNGSHPIKHDPDKHNMQIHGDDR